MVAYLALKGLSLRAIQTDLMDTLGSDAGADSFVRHCLREACYLPSDQGTPSVEDD
jgi:hypothetical protein